MINRQYRLKSRPAGRVERTDFTRVEDSLPDLDADQALIRVLYLSIDPTNRIWMSDRDQYMPPVAIGEVMRGVGLGRVVASRTARYAEGDLVTGLLGWQDYCVVGRGAVPVGRVPPGLDVPLSALLGACGVTGLTAYFGLLEIGKPKAGETVVVSAAAGGVGSIAGQIARIKGCRAVGIAGGPMKCRHLVENLGFEAALDYRAPDFAEQLAAATPDGIDVNFENVGGAIMEAVMARMNVGGRMPLCGMISGYNEPGPMRGDFAPILMRRIHVEGFIISDFAPRFAEATTQLAEWVSKGAIRYDETIIEGLDEAPTAINQLFDGANLGKLIVRVDAE